VEKVAQTDLTLGAEAPDFAAPDENGREWRLSDALQRSAQVLVFYRGDW
jgi:peroxiredoxin